MLTLFTVRTVETGLPGTGWLASNLLKMRLLKGGTGKGKQGEGRARSPMKDLNVVFPPTVRVPELNK